MEINHIIVVEIDGDIVHQVGYTNMPTEEDFMQFYNELMTDEEFGLSQEALDRATFRHGTQEEVEFVRTLIKDKEL